ncbi:ANK [Mytilus coruscus]|uniref:ANK n=1 Tax=Mytilus coruscus TaxID=42192 RepID=A0A6J8BR28_MYTCO|nr:ANK [Mytilus coruscus]
MQDGDTPLFAVSRMGFKDIAEILLENGADYHKCLHSEEAIAKSLKETESFENEKQAWLDDVIYFGSQTIATYIENKSVDYVFSVFAGSSPLHVACFMGHIEICRLLTEKLSSVDIRKEDGTTPLFYACELGHLAIVRVLLDKGANPKIQRDDLSTPLTIAEVNGHTDVLSLLTKH